ncbi:MAG TPA: hypothetical protein VGK01_14635 [Candidatus Angelobacter sp.]
MRELPPTPVTGPTLVYKRAKSGDASFFCSRCGLDFATTDPLEAFQGFAQHQHGCASVRKKPRRTQAAS